MCHYQSYLMFEFILNLYLNTIHILAPQEKAFIKVNIPCLSNLHPSPLVHDGGDEVHVHLPGVKDPPPLLVVALLACTLTRASCSLHAALQTTCCTAAGARVARTRAGAPTLLTTTEDGEVGGCFCTVYLGYAM